MDTQTIKRTSPKGHSARRECCDDTCTSGSRNNYFLGKRLTPDSFRTEQSYLVDRRRLLNRAIHGWGVVYGFPMKTAGNDKCPDVERGHLKIGEGLGLDKLGRELVQARPITLTLDNIVILGGRRETRSDRRWRSERAPIEIVSEAEPRALLAVQRPLRRAASRSGHAERFMQLRAHRMGPDLRDGRLYIASHRLRQMLRSPGVRAALLLRRREPMVRPMPTRLSKTSPRNAWRWTSNSRSLWARFRATPQPSRKLRSEYERRLKETG